MPPLEQGGDGGFVSPDGHVAHPQAPPQPRQGQQARVVPPAHRARRLRRLGEALHALAVEPLPAAVPEPLAAPSRATYVAVRVEDEDRAAELQHIVALCGHFGVPPPQGGGTQWAATLGPLRFKWERHGEFSSYTFFTAGLSAAPFAQPVVALRSDSQSSL